MDKYNYLKDFIYKKQKQVIETFEDLPDDEFGNGMKEAFRKIVEEIEEKLK